MPKLRERKQAEKVEEPPTETAKKQKPNRKADSIKNFLNKEPVRIKKRYYDKAVLKIRNYDSKVKRKQPLIERSGELEGRRAVHSCQLNSINALNHDLVQTISYTPTWSLLVKMLRKALLAHNWSYCLRLQHALLQHGSLRRQHLLYLIRLTFILMFNLNVSSERLNNFLTITLAIRSRESREAFLWSLIELKKFPIEDPVIVRKVDRPSQEDYSDVTAMSDEEDDPDNIVPSDKENRCKNRDPASEKNDSDSIVLTDEEKDPDDIVSKNLVGEEKDPTDEENDSDSMVLTDEENYPANVVSPNKDAISSDDDSSFSDSD